LPGCCKLDHPVFTSLDFTTIFPLRSKVVILASNPQPGAPCLCTYAPPPLGYTPRHRVPFSFPSSMATMEVL
jgi:hypothetical protein